MQGKVKLPGNFTIKYKTGWNSPPTNLKPKYHADQKL